MSDETDPSETGDASDDGSPADRRVHGLLLAMEETRTTGDAFVNTVVAAWSRESRGTRAHDHQKRRRLIPWSFAAVGALVVGAAFAFVTRGGPTGERRATPSAADPSRKAAPSSHAVAAPPPTFTPPSPARTPGADDLAPPALSLDFEDGEVPAILVSGAVVAGPPREGSRFCLLAGVSEWSLRTNTIMLKGGSNGLFRYDRRRVLRFAYWIGPGARQIIVQARNGDKNLNYDVGIQPRVRGAWAQAEIPLSSFEPFDRATPMRDGDTLVDLFIVAGELGGAPLYVDNIQVVDPP